MDTAIFGLGLLFHGTPFCHRPFVPRLHLPEIVPFGIVRGFGLRVGGDLLRGHSSRNEGKTVVGVWEV